MGTIKIILGFAVFVLIMSTAWQIASCEIANHELKDELKDVAALTKARIGLPAEQTDEELRATVIRKAADHDIVLGPDQILVRHLGTEENPKIYLAAKYRARVWMPGISLVFHFTATSGG